MTTVRNEPHPRVLVLRGSPDPAVRRIADTVVDELRAQGVHADIATPSRVRGLGGYDGVVVGSRLRWRHWHPAAARFLRRHTSVLRVRPLWLFQVDRHSRLAAAGALTGLAPERVPRMLCAVVDAPEPVTFGDRDGSVPAARCWARSIAASCGCDPHPGPAHGSRTSPACRQADADAAPLTGAGVDVSPW